MKTYVNFWLLCLILLFLGTVETHAQRFYFKELFKNCEYSNKKHIPQKFYATDKYGHQWELAVDGVLAKSDVDCLHVGTTDEKSQIICLATTAPFKDVDLVRVSTNIASGRRGRGYEVSMTLGSGKDKFYKTRKYTKRKEDLNDDLSNFYITEGNINSGTLKIEMKGDNYEKGALFLYFIEVASVLSDQHELQDQHIKLGEIYSYQVQRIFSKDYWNTICLPFDVEESQVQELFGNTHRLRTFTGNVDANGTMIFTETKEIKAGVPYLLKPAKTVESPIFTNVIYTNAEPTVVSDSTGAFSFVGAFNPTELQTDGTELFLGNGDNLYKPSSLHNRMNGMRAFFRIKKNSNALSNGKYAIRFDDETTAVMDILPELKSHKPCIYNLQGMRVDDSQPLPPGIYVKNGKKICVSK